MALPPPNTTTVGIEKDNKNAQGAVRWAIDNLVATSNPFIILLHVKNKPLNQGGGMNNGAADGPRDPTEGEQAWIFAQYRGYCSRRRIQAKEVVIVENDVAKGLLDFINNNYINNIVVGASTRSAFSRSRKYKNDIWGALNKSVPDFCSVFVISKSKLVSARSAQWTPVNTAVPPRHPPAGARPLLMSADDAAGGQSVRPGRRISDAERLESVDFCVVEGGRSSVSRSSVSEEPEALESLGLGTNLLQMTPGREFTPGSVRDVEAEMRKLRLELKQTMEMYSSACKEALSAKKKTKELEEWKMGESRKVEHARLAVEAALAVAEAEKANCRAAMEAAEAAQRLADIEVRKRRYAELKARREAEERNRALTVLHSNEARYRRYSIDEIEAATNKFAASMKIGEGGYGPVYKGKIDHTAVAVKILRPDATQGRKQFNQEVEVLSSIRHPNMVLLLGVCPDYGCLVYEFLDNGSLEDRIFRRGGTPPMPVKLRFKIAAEIATALRFLHQTKPEPLVHRDLKPANILLDRNFVSKISDVGLARLVPPAVADEVTQYYMTSAAGTFCYIDPEYQQTGMLGIKSDVYSLGILLLQLITARPPVALSHHVERALEKGTFVEMLDPTADWPMDETLSFAKMALRCAELRKKDRPDLGSVVLPELRRISRVENGLELNTSKYSGQAQDSQSMD